MRERGVQIALVPRELPVFIFCSSPGSGPPSCGKNNPLGAAGNLKYGYNTLLTFVIEITTFEFPLSRRL